MRRDLVVPAEGFLASARVSPSAFALLVDASQVALRQMMSAETVRWLGQFDVETHWELDDFGVLGAGFGDEAFQALLAQWLGFIDGQVQACLLKSAEEIQIPAGG
jgi:hypothetical protein